MRNSLVGLAAIAILGSSMPPGFAQMQRSLEAPSPSAKQQLPQGAQNRATRRAIRQLGGYMATRGDSRRYGLGWTNRHQQRVAMKKRNAQRHRAACRG